MPDHKAENTGDTTEVGAADRAIDEAQGLTYTRLVTDAVQGDASSASEAGAGDIANIVDAAGGEPYDPVQGTLKDIGDASDELADSAPAGANAWEESAEDGAATANDIADALSEGPSDLEETLDSGGTDIDGP